MAGKKPQKPKVELRKPPPAEADKFVNGGSFGGPAFSRPASPLHGAMASFPTRQTSRRPAPVPLPVSPPEPPDESEESDAEFEDEAEFTAQDESTDVQTSERPTTHKDVDVPNPPRTEVVHARVAATPPPAIVKAATYASSTTTTLATEPIETPERPDVQGPPTGPGERSPSTSTPAHARRPDVQGGHPAMAESAPATPITSERSDVQAPVETSARDVQTPNAPPSPAALLAARHQTPRRPDAQAPSNEPSIGHWAPGHPDVQASERSGTQTPEHPDIQASRHSGAEEPERSGAQTLERPNVEAPGRPDTRALEHPDTRAFRHPDAQPTASTISAKIQPSVAEAERQSAAAVLPIQTTATPPPQATPSPQPPSAEDEPFPQPSLPPSRSIVKRTGGRELRRMTIYLEPELAQRLKVASFEQGREMSAIIQEALLKHLSRKPG